jgi:hypothetical protein
MAVATVPAVNFRNVLDLSSFLCQRPREVYTSYTPYVRSASELCRATSWAAVRKLPAISILSGGVERRVAPCGKRKGN